MGFEFWGLRNALYPVNASVNTVPSVRAFLLLLESFSRSLLPGLAIRLPEIFRRG
jgi:hypothetical protein